jgi:hypothetical protein
MKFEWLLSSSASSVVRYDHMRTCALKNWQQFFSFIKYD